MLKLVYHSNLFGPIDLEFERAIIRVGSSEDNDLVVRHPSVKAHHCRLLFRGEGVFLLPPGQGPEEDAAHQPSESPELGLGDSFNIGEVRFSLLHSSKTVALPAPRELPSLPKEPPEPGLYCPHCRVVVPESKLKRVGIVGRAKHTMCPKCSHLLATEDETPPQFRELRNEKPS